MFDTGGGITYFDPAFAKKIGCPVPLFAATRPVYQAALADGHGMHDTASVCAILEKKARLRRRKPKQS